MIRAYPSSINPHMFRIFQQGSKTYFYSSLFFPKDVRSDVFTLYSFVRTADDFIDAVPQQLEAFNNFRHDYEQCYQGQESTNLIVQSFVDISKKYQFDPAWINSFFRSMTADATKHTYETMDELDIYMYGSAGVIGLMMSRILQLPEQSYQFAKKLGHAMQMINFIRDINEDLHLGRTYLPQDTLKYWQLPNLSENETRKRPDQFISFIRMHINYYRTIQREAEEGFSMIPRRFRIPIKTASDMYQWTAWKIYQNPFRVYEEKIKPSVYQVIIQVGKNTV